MTRENEKLLLKDLCARLPYGVKCEDKYGNVLELHGIHKSNCITFKCSDKTFWSTNLDECKLYLFPLSSMTKEQKEFIKNKFCYDWDINDHPYSLWANCIETGKADELIDWFLENNFDYRGLIPMGLANDATGLNIY